MITSATTRFSIASLAQQPGEKSQTVAESPANVLEIADETILGRIHVGDREALGMLFRRYAHSIRNIGRRILRDRGEADDLVQEVFLYIHRKSVLFDSTKGSARSWIVQVAYTQAFLRRRHLKSHGFYLSAIADKLPETEYRTNLGGEYDRTVEGLFGRIGWRKVLETLTAEQRETLRLHFFEGYTFGEIAEKLGQSYANIRHHHYRGLVKLREQLSEDELSRR